MLPLPLPSRQLTAAALIEMQNLRNITLEKQNKNPVTESNTKHKKMVAFQLSVILAI